MVSLLSAQHVQLPAPSAALDSDRPRLWPRCRGAHALQLLVNELFRNQNVLFLNQGLFQNQHVLFLNHKVLFVNQRLFHN